MKKNKKFWLGFVLLVLLLTGCGDKSSALEGKIVDGKDQPLADVKVVARMVNPVEGYAQSETTTDAEGLFKFEGLYPESHYNLTFASDKWLQELKTEVKSGRKGESAALPDMKIRFMEAMGGVYTDTKTDLQWVPVCPTGNFHDAKKWVADLDGIGRGWRMPKRADLSLLTDYSDVFFGVSYVWTDECQEIDGSDRCYACVPGGNCEMADADDERGVFAVRRK